MHGVHVHAAPSRVANALHGTCCPNCLTQHRTRSRMLAHLRYSRRCYSIVVFLNAPDDEIVKAKRRQEIKDRATRKLEQAPHLPAVRVHGPCHRGQIAHAVQTSLDLFFLHRICMTISVSRINQRAAIMKTRYCDISSVLSEKLARYHFRDRARKKRTAGNHVRWHGALSMMQDSRESQSQHDCHSCISVLQQGIASWHQQQSSTTNANGIRRAAIHGLEQSRSYRTAIHSCCSHITFKIRSPPKPPGDSRWREGTTTILLPMSSVS